MTQETHEGIQIDDLRTEREKYQRRWDLLVGKLREKNFEFTRIIEEMADTGRNMRMLTETIERKRCYGENPDD